VTTHLGRLVGGKYRLDAVIGIGGMATVYRATHNNGHAVAVKILHPELALRADLRERFLREGYIANAVPHEGAVTVLDDGVLDEGSPFLVLELLEGETVEARWEGLGRRLEVTEVIEIADRVLAILEAAHPRGIVHRDIKPANLFLSRDGTLKLLDFGIARMLDSEGGSQTVTGAVPGSPAFMAPEQALGFASDIDGRTDLFAVGSTMFALLGGRPIHVAKTPAQLHVFACSNAAPPLRTVAPDVPEAIARVVDGLLAFSKNDRPESAAVARELLADARANPRKRRTKIRLWWVLSAALAIPVGGFAIAAATDRPPRQHAVSPVPDASVASPEPHDTAQREVEAAGAAPPPIASSAMLHPSASTSSTAPHPIRRAAPSAGRDAGAPARQDPCEPPFFIDRETGTRRVKPGC
jgi:serine/threonine-protein kinase